MDPLRRWIICLALLFCRACSGIDFMLESTCPDSYRFNTRSCFRVTDSSSANFAASRTSCQGSGSNGDLLTASTRLELQLVEEYLTLVSTTTANLWLGLQYMSISGSIRLVDINGDEVDDVELGVDFASGTAAVGMCVSVRRAGDGVEYLREACVSASNGALCMSDPNVPALDISSTPNGYGVAGQSLTITCSHNVGKEVEVIWRLNGDRIDNNFQSASITNGIGGGELTISSFDTSVHSGNYSCSTPLSRENGETVTGTASSDLNIRVGAQPVIARQPQNVTIYFGSVGFFECSPGTSYPVPTVTWYKDGTVLTNSTADYFISPNTLSLIIVDTQSADVGAYRCELNNGVGDSVESEIGYLSVATRPVVDPSEIVNLLAPSSSIVEYQGSITLDCVSQFQGTGIPFYAWEKLITGDSVPKDTVQPVTQSLPSITFGNFQFVSKSPPASFDQLRCVYGATIREESMPANLTIVERVKITSISGDSVANLGSRIQLQCHFRGTPMPVVRWYRNGDVLPVTQHTEVENVAEHTGMSTLTIEELGQQDVGTYVCRVTNFLQSAVASTSLYSFGAILESTVAINQSALIVQWQPPPFPRGNQDLLRYTVNWTVMQNGVSVRQFGSELLSSAARSYIINDLSTKTSVDVFISTHYYGGESPSVVGTAYPLGGAPATSPIVMLKVSEDRKSLTVTWTEVKPDRANLGEGEIDRYQIRYYECNKDPQTDSRMITQSASEARSRVIEDLNEDRNYVVQVRAGTITQSEPTEVVAYGPWSDANLCTAAVTADDSSDNSVVIIVVVVVVVIIVLLIAVILLLFLFKRNGTLGKYYPSKNEAKKGVLRINQDRNVLASDSSFQYTSNGTSNFEA